MQTLRNAVAAQRLHHAYLFAGPRGTGKTTTARLLAKALNCLAVNLAERPCDHCDHCQAVNQGRFMDLLEIDAASNTSVEDVRDLRDKINFSPSQGQYKVYIIDEVHMLSTAAFNALLKTLEEPPAHAVFILATTEVHKIPATVLSRCQRHEFRRIPVNDIVSYLQRIVDAEGIEAEPAALTVVARQATGAMRDAISLLDQLASTGSAVTLEVAHSVLGTAASQAVIDVMEAVVAKDAAAGLDALHQALDAGSDPRQLGRQVVDYLRSLLMVRSQNGELVDAPPELRPQMARHAQALGMPELLRLVRIFNQAVTEGRSSWLPALPLEMAVMDAVQSPVLVAAAPLPVTAPPGAPAAQPAPRPPAAPRSAARSGAAAPDEAHSVEETIEASDPAESQQLESHWPQILTAVRQQNSSLYGAINSARARSLKGSVLTLGFQSEILRSKVDNPASLQILREVLRQAFGHEVQVRCVVMNDKRSTPPPGVDSEGMVASALRDLGGEIVDVQ